MKKLFSVLLLLLSLSLCAGCESPSPAYQFRSQELDKYVIVYQEKNPDYFDLAIQLSDRIAQSYGVALQILPDVAAQPAEFEILLGDTNRYEPTGRVMEYSVSVAEGKFRINVGGSFSAENAILFLCDRVFNGQELSLDAGEYYKKSLLTKANELTEGTTARIMTANILADLFADGSYRKAYYRAEIFAGMLLANTPDVVGLQEADESWNETLQEYLDKLQRSHGITYSQYLNQYEDMVNFTSFVYRSDKFQVQTGGVQPFTWWTDPAFTHSYHMRNITWAQFAPLTDSGKPFIVANTHWSYRTEHAGGNTYLQGAAAPIIENELRQQCKEETNNFLSTLKQQNPAMPIFVTGDFNTSLPFFTQSGWTAPGFGIISQEAKSQGVSANAVPESGHFDHLFGTGSYRILRYAHFQNTDHTQLLTDHPFAYADLAF